MFGYRVGNAYVSSSSTVIWNTYSLLYIQDIRASSQTTSVQIDEGEFSPFGPRRNPST